MSEDTITTITTTPNIEELQAKCFTTITELFEKYKDHEYMLQRINTHIVNYLPNKFLSKFFSAKTNTSTYQVITFFTNTMAQIF